MRLILSCAALAALTACANPCADLCKEIAAYAEECGYTVPEGEPQACIEASPRSNFTPEELEVCRGAADDLRDEWTCEDVGDYFDDGAATE